MTSALTLATLRSRVAAFLNDVNGQFWPQAELDEAVRHALDELNRAALLPRCPIPPRLTSVTLTPGLDARQVPLASWPDLMGVREVWFPYPGSDAAPNRVEYIELCDTNGARALWLLGDQAGDGILTARILGYLPHTLNGLDGASSTTWPARADSVLVLGAAGYAAYERAFYNVEDSSKGTFAAPNEGELAARLLQDFRAQLGLVQFSGDSSFSMYGLEPAVKRTRTS